MQYALKTRHSLKLNFQLSKRYKEKKGLDDGSDDWVGDWVGRFSNRPLYPPRLKNRSTQKRFFFVYYCCKILSDMEKKEFHRHYLPHFQQPGQAYFVTWSLKVAARINLNCYGNTLLRTN